MIPLSPRYIFGAGEMADHIVRLLESIGMPIRGIELFDDGFPGRTVGPAGLPIVANFADGMERCLSDRDPVMVAAGTKGAAVGYQITEGLAEAGIPLASVRHPSLQVGPGSRLQPHLVAMPGCVVGKNAWLGRWCWLYSGVIIEHDAVIGDGVIFGPGVVMAGHINVGALAFLGAGVTVGPGIAIGAGSVIGAGAVVVRDIPPGVIAAGVPAKVLRPVESGSDGTSLETLRRLGIVS